MTTPISNPDPNTQPLAAYGLSLSGVTLLGVKLYATQFPDAAAGLMAELKDGRVRFRVVSDFGSGDPIEVSVISLTPDHPPLELARITIPVNESSQNDGFGDHQSQP